MSVPNFQRFMIPILEAAADGQPHKPIDFENYAADKLGLSLEDRALMLTSGGMTVLRDRTGWAYYHLFRAGLLERPLRATYRITERGLETLRADPTGIDQKYLRRFPEYLIYLAPKPKDESNAQGTPAAPEIEQTPKGQIKDAFGLLQKQLALELLEQIAAQSPTFFETLVVKLLIKMGYGGSQEEAARVVGRSGDGGIDGIIKEDRLGLDTIYVQAKRWKGNVGTSEIRNFVGSLAGGEAHKGVFITTSGFQPGVQGYLRGVKNKIVLIDGDQLAALCIEFGIGVVVEETISLKKIDLDFFDEA
jgi:restriction system protein